MRALLLTTSLLLAAPALACNYPDEGNMPLRRALTRVQMLPETSLWEREQRDRGLAVQYRLYLEKEVLMKGKCHWTAEALADGKLWRRFYVTPDGKHVLTDIDGSAPR